MGCLKNWNSFLFYKQRAGTGVLRRISLCCGNRPVVSREGKRIVLKKKSHWVVGKSAANNNRVIPVNWNHSKPFKGRGVWAEKTLVNRLETPVHCQPCDSNNERKSLDRQTLCYQLRPALSDLRNDIPNPGDLLPQLL